MALRKIRTEDEVVVLAGRDRGKTGKVRQILPDGRAIVSGVHLVKKHVRPNPQIGEPGGVSEREAPIQLSNLSLIHPETGKAARVGFALGEDGKYRRVFKKDGKPVDDSGGSK